MLLRRKLFGSESPVCLETIQEILGLSLSQAFSVSPPMRVALTVIQEKANSPLQSKVLILQTVTG